MKSKGYKQCPGCGIWASRVDGCNIVVCSVCSKVFSILHSTNDLNIDDIFNYPVVRLDLYFMIMLPICCIIMGALSLLFPRNLSPSRSSPSLTRFQIAQFSQELESLIKSTRNKLCTIDAELNIMHDNYKQLRDNKYITLIMLEKIKNIVICESYNTGLNCNTPNIFEKINYVIDTGLNCNNPSKLDRTRVNIINALEALKASNDLIKYVEALSVCT